MAADAILRTYGDSAIKEDVVLNAVEILTAKETQVFNMLGKTTANSTIHSYLTDTLRSPSIGALNVEEAADFAASANSTPTRLTNLVQIVALEYKVSRTQQQVLHYTGENELSRQTSKAMMDWANQAEFELLRSAVASGASGTAPAMDGIIAGTSLANNHTSHTSGTIFNTTILDSLMANAVNNSNGDAPTELLMGVWLRQKMDQAIAKSNIVVNGAISDIVRTVSTYTTAFGTVSIRYHRYIQQSGDATARILAIRPDKLKVAFLVNGGKPYVDTELARSGDYDVRAIIGKFTLEIHNKNSHFYADGFNLSS